MRTDIGTEVGILYTTDYVGVFRFTLGVRYDEVRYHRKRVRDDTYYSAGVIAYTPKEDYRFSGFGPILGIQIGRLKGSRIIYGGLDFGLTSWNGSGSIEYVKFSSQSVKSQYSFMDKLFFDTKLHAGYYRIINSIAVGMKLYYRFAHADLEEYDWERGFDWDFYGALFKLDFKIR